MNGSHAQSMTPEKQRASPLRTSLPYLLAPVPALAVGVLIMRTSGVPTAVWAQNLAAWVAGTLLCLGVWSARTSSPRGRWAGVVAALTVGALAATLLAPDVEGVHRWVPLGPVRLHPASALLPLLLVALDRLSQARGGWVSALLALGVTFALFLQPDAAQATAFAAASVVLLLPRAGGAPRRACILSVLVLAGVTWLRRDPLAPVPHVEGIVGLAASLGVGWTVAAVLSLLVLPIPFLLTGRGAGRYVGVALGTYVTITLLAPFVGSFPVPVMGYGVSPIIGYLAGLGIFLRTGTGSEREDAAG